jgi:hypothetical protein
MLRSPPVAHEKPRPSPRSVGVDGVGRGCVKNDPHHNREPGFFAIAVEKIFSFRADWHEADRAKPLVRQYQTALDWVLQSHGELRRCVAHCTHCGIRFLTDPRNAGRRDLGCPFGCRQHHRRQCSSRRSTAYYQTAAGKRKKKRLNGRRHGSRDSAAGQPQEAPGPQATSSEEQPRDPWQGKVKDPWQGKVELRLEGVVLCESSLAKSPVLPYVRMVVSLIEGISLSCEEVVRLLRRAMRQHSIAHRRRIDYVLGFLDRHPP